MTAHTSDGFPRAWLFQLCAFCLIVGAALSKFASEPTPLWRWIVLLLVGPGAIYLAWRTFVREVRAWRLPTPSGTDALKARSDS